MAEPVDIVLRGVSDSAAPSPLLAAALAIPVVGVSGYLAWSDGTAVGLGLALLGPSAAVLTWMGARFFAATATHLTVEEHTLVLTPRGGLGTEARLPIEDLLSAKVERGAGRYNQTLELWTRRGPVPIQVGGHSGEEIDALIARLVALGEARREALGITLD
jgi:hypothetical protein